MILEFPARLEAGTLSVGTGNSPFRSVSWNRSTWLGLGSPPLCRISFRKYVGLPHQLISNRNLCLDHIVIGPHASVGGAEKSGGRQRLDVCVDVAVVAPERLSWGSYAGDLVPADVVQQLYPFAGQTARESVLPSDPLALMEGLTVLRAAPGIDEPLQDTTIVRFQRRWRRRRDSNPRYAFRAYNGLANRRLQPLGHISVREKPLLNQGLRVNPARAKRAQQAQETPLSRFDLLRNLPQQGAVP